MPDEPKDDYGLGLRTEVTKVKAPDIDYLPAATGYPAVIGLVGAGGITVQHLSAYKAAGYRVAAICDVNPAAAEAMRARFYPEAKVFSDYRQVLAMPEINIVDAATHPEIRYTIVKDALEAGKHVLSQKPFVTDLDRGEELCRLAEAKGLKLAVNHNGRWAPHFRYATRLIREGYVGAVSAVHLSVVWNHNWVKGTKFEDIKYCILYDFGIHWFDILNVFMDGARARRVYASTCRTSNQEVRPDFMSQASVEFDTAQATLTFEADSRYGSEDRTVVVGTEGMIVSEGPDLNVQSIGYVGKRGSFRPVLEGNWFPGGFHGTMAELINAVAENREPENSGRSSLRSLELCFAALESAERKAPVEPGKARRLIS